MVNSILEDIRKIASRSYFKDFTAGIDPTGTYTFKYGLRDAPKSDAESRRRKAIGTFGGFLSGALLIPSVIYGLIYGGMGAKRGLGNAARQFGHGFAKPYRDIYRGFVSKRGLAKEMSGQRLTDREASVLGKVMKERGGALLSGGRSRSPSQVRTGLRRLARINPDALGSMKQDASEMLGIGLGSMALGGAINASSAIAQYNAARGYGKNLSEEERNRMLGT